VPGSFEQQQSVQRPQVDGQGEIVYMPETIHIGIQERWWVLRHLNPQWIDQQLSQLNEQRAACDMEALVYFIPHQYVREAFYKKENGKAYNKKVRENNMLRSSLHYYLFVKATEPDIYALVSGEWNRTSRLRLSLCRTKSGEPLWATAKEMDNLIQLMSEYREMFNLEPSPDGFQVADKVMLKAKVFKGYEFYVTKVRKRETGVSLTLELPIFNGRFILKSKSVDVAEQHLPMKIQEWLSPDYVKKVDQTLINIVRHRYGRRKSNENRLQMESDSQILHDLQFLSYMEFDDSQIHHHVKVLLLLHAVLRKDRHSVEHYIPVVQRMLSNAGQPANDEDAFIMAVLYLATHDVNFRDAAKQYEQHHKTLSEPLSQLMPVIKYIRFRNTPQKRISKKLERQMTKQVEDTLRQLRDCDFGSLPPQGASAVWDILALPPYNTEEGHAFQVRLKEAARQSLEKAERQLQCEITDGGKARSEAEKSAWEQVIQHFSGTSEANSSQATQHSLNQARGNLLHTVHPSAVTLVNYYGLLTALHPDRNVADSAPLYQEYIKILLRAYSKTQQLTTPWWQMKSVLEHYYHAGGDMQSGDK